MIYLKNICWYVQFLHSYSRKRDRAERMKQWYGNLSSSPNGLFITDLLLPCVKKKKKNQNFKPIPIPKIFGILIKHWIQKKHFFIITAYQSYNLFHYGNVLEINNKGWFLQGLKKVCYLKLKAVKIPQITWSQYLNK